MTHTHLSDMQNIARNAVSVRLIANVKDNDSKISHQNVCYYKKKRVLYSKRKIAIVYTSTKKNQPF